MPKAAVRTFQGGMVKDLDKSLISNDKYLEARNFRLVTSTGVNNSGLSSGALENIEGNNLVSTAIPNTMHVAGSAYLRDTLVLFLTTNTVTPTHGVGRNMVVSFEIDVVAETASNYTVHYDDSLNNNAGTLDFSTVNPVRCAVVYEAPNIQKIYWCDGYNHVRYANIAAYLTNDGLIKSGSNIYFTPDLLEFLPDVNFSVPYLDYIVAGDIKAGTVQYAFQYFNKYGAETSISPLSSTIHLVNTNDYNASSIDYKGEGNLASTAGRGVRIIIPVDNSDKYNYIRVIRVHYTSINSAPTITVVEEISINTGTSSVTYTDTGTTSLGTITLDEFNIGQTELFSAKDIAVKDGRLFAANIVKDEFNIGDWDSRAVRFDVNNEAVVVDNLSLTDVVITDPRAGATEDWTNNGWEDYLPDHDGINRFNNPGYDGQSQYEYKYLADGTTLGAEGPNIRIGFTTDMMVIDSSGNGSTFFSTTESTADNKSYTSFASPYKAGSRSWQRDEVYRLYIVFFDAQGRSSSAKWVCDLRMPSLREGGNYSILSQLNVTDVETMALYPTVELKSFPAGAVSAQLLKVQRTGTDRSILTQALVVPVRENTGELQPYNMSTSILSSNRTVKLVSPEINILKNVSQASGDYLEYITYFDSTNVTQTILDHNGDPKGTIYKLKDSNTVAYDANSKAVVDETKNVDPLTGDFTLGGAACSNYCYNLLDNGSTGMFVHHGNPTWGADGHTYVVANYRRDVHSSQYGGQTYEDRFNNVAIPASGLITTIGVTTTALYGDTFIGYFDVNTGIFDLTMEAEGSLTEAVYVPLESSVNTELRHDNSMRKEYGTEYVYFMQEVAGNWASAAGGATEIYRQATSLYQYNTVYSQESTSKFYVNEPDTVSQQTEFDCMVRVSKQKLNSELQDSWTVFPVNDFTEVNSKFGPVTTLITLNNRLLFWQDNAFGILSVNERSLIQDGTGASLVLGTGGILDRYDYASDKVGAKDNRSVVATQTGVYWANVVDSCIYRFADQLVNLSKSKVTQSLGDVRLALTDSANIHIRAAYDTKYNCVLMTVYNSSSNVGVTLCYDEGIDAFTAFYDYYTDNYIPFSEGYLTTGESVSLPYNVYFHNSKLADRCTFYGAKKDSSIKVIFNDEYVATKVYDNLFWLSEATTADITTNIPRDVNVYNNTFSSIRCYNTYQNTDYCNLTYGTNLERDERDWTTFVPRNAVSSSYIGNPFIFDPANLDKTRQFRERIRDKYMVVDFKYTNANNVRFVVPYVAAKYRISPR